MNKARFLSLFIPTLLAAATVSAQVKLAEIPGGPLPGIFSAATGVSYYGPRNEGYISNPGSGAVLKFRPATGEILATLQLPPGVGPLAISPDGLNLVVANTVNQRIYIIEPTKMEVRKESGYQPSGFTAQCNILFGENATSFFIADPSRDGVAAFATWTGAFDHVIPVGINPNNMALRPDGKRLVVLCSGKQPGDEESIYIIDTLAVAVTDYAKLPNLDMEPFNTLQWDVTGFQIYASAFNNNRIVVYDTRTSALSYRESKGTGPTRIFTPPNGRFLAVIHPGSKSIALLSLPDLLLHKDIIIPGMEFTRDSMVAFSTDSYTLFIPSLATGEIIAYDLNALSIRSRIPVGKGPTLVHAAPGGTVVNSVDIGSNLLSLVALNPTAQYIPDLIQNPGQYSGIAIANFGADVTSISLLARDDSGRLIPGNSNPRLVKVRPGEQIKGVAWQLFDWSPAERLSGYIEAYTLSQGISTLYLTGNTGETQLDGFIADGKLSKLLGFSRITEGMSRFGGQTSTEIILLNPADVDAHMQLRLYYRTLQGPGTLIGYTERTLPARQRIRQRISDFMPNAFYPLENAYLEVNSDALLKGLALVRIGDSLAAMPAHIRGLHDTEFTAPHFVSGGAGVLDTPIFSDLGYCNSSQEPIIVTAQVKDASDKIVPPGGKPATKTLALAETVSGGADAMLGFPNPLTDPALYQGTLEIRANHPGLLVDLLYGDARNGSYLAPAHFESERGLVIGFGHLVQGVFAGTEYFTGIAMRNPARGMVDIVVAAYRPDGTLLGQGNHHLAAGSTESKTIAQLVPEAAQQNGGTVIIRCDAPLLVYGVWGGKQKNSTVQQFLAAVPPIILVRQ